MILLIHRTIWVNSQLFVYNTKNAENITEVLLNSKKYYYILK